MKTFTLNPIDSRKSFYNKCQVIQEDYIYKLQSYQTIVAEFNSKTAKMKIKGYYSPTTARHINSFLNYFGFNPMSKKEIEAASK